MQAAVSKVNVSSYESYLALKYNPRWEEKDKAKISRVLEYIMPNLD
jgi:hypothetical protein